MLISQSFLGKLSVQPAQGGGINVNTVVQIKLAFEDSQLGQEPAARPGRDSASGPPGPAENRLEAVRREGLQPPPRPPVQFGQHLRGQQMSFQAMRLTSVFSTTYPVQVGGLRAKLDSSECEHNPSRVDSSSKGGLIRTPHLASDELYRAILFEARLFDQAIVSVTRCNI